MQSTFSIGVLVDQRCSLHAWEVAMLQDCLKKGIVQKVTVLVQKQRASIQKKSFLYWLFCRFENSWFANEEDATEKIFLQKEKSMAELKTQRNNASVEAFLNNVPDEEKRKDCFIVLELMKKISKEEPAMWGDSIVGFGSYHL